MREAAVGAGQANTDIRYSVSVRHLCEFAARAGDLDLRFTPAPSAQQGREGHVLVAQRRGPLYEAEVSLSGTHGELLVRGRADGFDAGAGQLEEFKTFRGSLDGIGTNQQLLHWAQLKVYGWLLCRARGLHHITLCLVYFDVADQSEHPQAQDWSADQLQDCCTSWCEAYLAWARQQTAHVQRRDGMLEALEFPQKPFRAGQRELAAQVYRSAVQSRHLLVQAPTGIGKTIGTLFGALRAMPVRSLDKLFYLSAKTPGRQVALDALRRLQGAHGSAVIGPVRVLELVARDKACEHRDKACHGDSCPLAWGFFDRLGAARAAAAQQAWLDQASLRSVALAHQVCPYYLGHEMVRWSDVVVGDYNYYFDRHAMLYAMAVDAQWRFSVLVDEAHNLVPRACAMYSAELGHDDALELRVHATAAVQVAVDAWLDQWQLLQQSVSGQVPAVQWALLDELPPAWMRCLQRVNSAIGEQLQGQTVACANALLPTYFRTLAFAALAEAFGAHSLCEFDLSPLAQQADGGLQRMIEGLATLAVEPGGGRLCLRNVVPAPFVAQRIKAADSMVLFSATLNPHDYYINLLGLPDNTPLLDIASPFAAHQLDVLVKPLSTRRNDRSASLGALVDTMAAHYGAHPGNYLAFFGSFDYLDAALQQLRTHHPQIPAWAQGRQMDELARREFLLQFDATGQGIAFAVLGGVFGEGVDLPGRRLIGAFIATLGLPRFDQVNAAICERLQARFGRGHDYTYVYPGLQKVVQAAGRVLRSETDTGSVLLLDDRYLEPRYRALLPSWWQVRVL